MKFFESKRNLATAKQPDNWGEKKKKKMESMLKYALFAHLAFANCATVTRALTGILP